MIVLKKKTNNVIGFMNNLHNFIVTHPQFRVRTNTKSETQIQTEIRPVIISFLENYFRVQGVTNFITKAHDSFYWEGQEGTYKNVRSPVFGARNYPDFIIDDPYKVAIEYKQSPKGSTIKQGIGQSIMHTASGDFDFVYYLFHDQSEGGVVKNSLSRQKQTEINMISKMWDEFNVFIKIVDGKMPQTKAKKVTNIQTTGPIAPVIKTTMGPPPRANNVIMGPPPPFQSPK